MSKIFAKSILFFENNIEDSSKNIYLEFNIFGSAFKFNLYSLFEDKKNHIAKGKFLEGVYSFEKTLFLEKYSIFKIPFLRKTRKRKYIIKFLGLPIYFKDRTEEFFAYLKNRIEPGHDHVYIIRHNIGETFVYLSYLKEWLNTNKSKNPLIIVWRDKDLPLYKMMIESSVPLQLIYISSCDINIFFRNEITDWDGVRIFAPTFQIAESMKIAYENDNKTNFRNFILHSMHLKESTKISNSPMISSCVKLDISKKLQDWGIDHPFVLLCPHATTLKNLPDSFWSKLSMELRKRKIFVIVNSSEKNNRWDADIVCFLSIDQLYELATRATAIFSMASGLGVLLSSVGIPITLFYSSFRDQSMGFNSKVCLDIYSVKNFENFNKKNIHEIDIENSKDISYEQILDLGLKKSPDLSGNCV